MRRRLWNTCLVSPTFCKVFLPRFSSIYSARALIGIKHLISVQFQPLALFSYKSITLAPSQEANMTEKKKNPNPNRLKNSVPQEIVGNRQVQAEALGSNAGASAPEQNVQLGKTGSPCGMEPILPPSLVLQHPQSPGKVQQLCQQGQVQEQEQSCCQVAAGTVRAGPSQAHQGWVRSAYLGVCSLF